MRELDQSDTEINSDGRSTMIVNLCALCLAVIVTGEATFIGYHAYGHVRAPDTWGSFVAVAVMFAVRRKWFSYIFLVGYFYLSVLFAYVIYAGDVRHPINFEAAEGAFFIASLLSAVVFAASAVIRRVVNLIKGRR